jgi:phosphate transport system substrate-binding protein
MIQETEVKSSFFRRAIVPGATVLALALTGCGSANESNAAESNSDLSGTLSGGGSSAQEAAQNAWRAGFQEQNPDVTVNYDPIGSGGGVEQFSSGGFTFAGSDAYLTDDEGALSSATKQCGDAPIQVPDYVSPIAVIFNIDGVDELNLTPDTIAGIFNDEITTWDDPAIAEDNPEADLPSETITAVHRSDESGTSENFTNYLSTVAPDAWPHGAVETWPVKAGEGASGTSGVVDAVTNGSNTIGYADASQAGDLGQASVEVGGEFVSPSPEAAAKIFEVSPQADGASDTAMIYNLDYKTEDTSTYPIVLTSYLLACQTYDDQATADLVKGYLSYILSDEGQQTAAENAGSSPLPTELAGQAQEIVEGISAE